jgi:hypothetical protein
MTVGLLTKQAGNADLDQVFDPYVSGNSPAATGLNVGGTNTDINTRYAPISFGSAAAATGFNIEGTSTDINTLFAAYGTAVYNTPLSINGQSYSAAVTIPHASSGSAAIEFLVSSSGWVLSNQNNDAGGTSTPAAGANYATGANPAGATSVEVVDTWLNSSGDTGSGAATNGMATYTAITGTPVNYTLVVTGPGTDSDKQSTHQIVIYYKNAAGVIISTTSIQILCVQSGSV